MAPVNTGCSLQSSMDHNRCGRSGCPSNVRRDQCKCSSLIDVLAAKLELLSKALTDANTKNAAIWTKVDKELSSLNEYLALSTPGPLAAIKAIQLSDAAIKTATAYLVDRRKILERAVNIQKTIPTIRPVSEARPLDARKLGHSSSREEAKPIVVIAPCAPESTPRQTTATPDSSFYSTTADPSNSIGSDSLEEASLTWTERPKYVELSALLSVTDVKGATANSTPKSQPSWIGSDERSQVAKPTGKPTTCADVDIGECCENRTTTEAVKRPISSSTPSKVVSLIVDTVVAKDPGSQGLETDHSEPESPSYTQLARLIVDDSDLHTSTKERRLQPNQPHTICQIRQLLACCKVTINALLGHSDHCVLTFDFICYWARNPEPQTWIRNFCRADFSGMRIFLNQVKLGPASVEDLYRTIVQKVHEADAMFVLKKPARSRMSRKLPKRIRRLLEKRSHLFFKKLATEDTEDELAFRKVRKRCKSEIRQWNIRKQATILDLVRKNRNVLFKYMRHCRRNKPSAFSLRDRNGEPTCDTTAISEFHREHYVGLFSVPATSSHPTLSRRIYERPLTDLVLTVEDTCQLLHNINPFCALGPDEVHSRILSEMSYTLATHFHLLFCQWLDEGQLPSVWKGATVRPIYNACVRTPLKYANPVVYSGCTKDVILIERVQRAAMKMVAGLKSVDYQTRALCTEKADRTAAQIELKYKLRGSGHPSSFIRRQLRMALAPVEKLNRKWIRTAVFTCTFIRGLLKTANIRVAFRKGNTVLCTVVIERSPPGKRTGDFIYKIECNDCTKSNTQKHEMLIHSQNRHERWVELQASFSTVPRKTQNSLSGTPTPAHYQQLESNISLCKQDKAPGPDGMHPTLLEGGEVLMNILMTLLRIIWNRFLNNISSKHPMLFAFVDLKAAFDFVDSGKF
ncbi:hypothetical protein CLF_100039 [Clonorchis sinensis]|uniref:Reverse transcriptase domain-containing protein n=1 Tax=Clonorchis sinensis TaxID=79923 RepID=G7Y2I2_CLOSI|nr:hypothetical protein CLF_100039 [Clonorchis sinensis]